jgi:membrane protein DedA with SNARE-associated domain
VEAIDRWTGGHHLAPTERWFQARGHWAVFWGRFLPVVRTYISFPAGIGAMPVSRFVAYSLLGASPWTVVLTWIGLRFGRGANLTASITHVLYAVLVLVALAAGLTLWVRRQA